jgi:hypothetical protein
MSAAPATGPYSPARQAIATGVKRNAEDEKYSALYLTPAS